MEVSDDGGNTYNNDLSRVDYGFFQKAGDTNGNNVWIKVTSEDGDEVVVEDVEVTSDNIVQACSNFP